MFPAGASRWHLKEKLELQDYWLTRTGGKGQEGEKKRGGVREGGCYDLPGVLVLNVLNSTASLDTANSKTRRIGKAAYDTGLPLQGAL